MAWNIEYYEAEDGTQPAEVFEDWLDRMHPKLGGKLIRRALEVEALGPGLGGGYLEPCHSYPGMWEIRTRFQSLLGREFLGFDDRRAVLLHGYVKRAHQPAQMTEFSRAYGFWEDYLRTRMTSPEKDQPNESL